MSGGRISAEELADVTASAEASPAAVNGVFGESVHAGILVRRSVFPGQSIDGYVYFAFPGLKWDASAENLPWFTGYSYTLELTTNGTQKLIEFTVH
jgi:hypothetical protein